MLTIVIRELSGERRELARSKHRGTKAEAVGKAIRQRWGKRAFWWPDSGLGPDYGQVCRPLDGSTNTCVTGRVRIDVEGEG